VLGIANGNSIAAGCARAFSGAGEHGAKRSKSFLVTPSGAPFFQKSNFFS
jgi:hypothetical protein